MSPLDTRNALLRDAGTGALLRDADTRTALLRDADTRTALLRDADPWRGPPADPARREAYKEWQHFLVFGPSFTLLLNLSVDGTGAGRAVTVLCRRPGTDSDPPSTEGAEPRRASTPDRGDWHGDVTVCARAAVRPGTFDAALDRAGMRYRGGRYEVWQLGGAVKMAVALTPVSSPSLSHHIRLGEHAHLSWCLVPRLRASGWFEVGGRRSSFEDRLAYHDHNWGVFRWGGDFSWEWGCAMPEDPESPWTIVYARMNDRARTRTTATSVFLLKNGEHLRYFRDSEARFTTEGVRREKCSARIPAAAALLLPDRDRDVPARLLFEARRGPDRLDGLIESGARGQILMPSESDLRRVVRLNEVDTRVRLHGTSAGEPVNFDGPGLLEVVCG